MPIDFDKITSETISSLSTSESQSTSESSSINDSQLHETFEIDDFLPTFEPLKLSGQNLAQQYVSAFNTGMNVYQCLNYLQGYVYTLVTAMNQTIEAWNTVVPLLEQATKDWTDEEFQKNWDILEPQVIQMVKDLTLETFDKAWAELKPQVIQLCKDTTDEEFAKQWEILKPQVITLVQETTSNKFNEEWNILKPTLIQLTKDTTIEQFNASWTELKPQVITLVEETTTNKFNELWAELKPTLIQLSKDTTIEQFNESWQGIQDELKEKVQQITDEEFATQWDLLKPQVVELANTTTSTKFDEKWTELQPTLESTVNTLVENKLKDFKVSYYDIANDDNYPFLLPENFEAKGDGETDDTEAFKSCVLLAVQTNKPILLTKNYKITGTIEFNHSNRDIYIIGVGGTTIIFDNSDNLSLFNINLKSITLSHINFNNVNIKMNAFFDGVTNINIIGCNFTDFVCLNYQVNNITDNYIIDNCSFENFNFLFNEINNIAFSNTTFDNVYKLGDLNSTSINNCKFLSNLTYSTNEALPIFSLNNCSINNFNIDISNVELDINTDLKGIIEIKGNNIIDTLNINNFNRNFYIDFMSENSTQFNNCGFTIESAFDKIFNVNQEKTQLLLFNACKINYNHSGSPLYLFNTYNEGNNINILINHCYFSDYKDETMPNIYYIYSFENTNKTFLNTYINNDSLIKQLQTITNGNNTVIQNLIPRVESLEEPKILETTNPYFISKFKQGDQTGYKLTILYNETIVHYSGDTSKSITFTLPDEIKDTSYDIYLCPRGLGNILGSVTGISSKQGFILFAFTIGEVSRDVDDDGNNNGNIIISLNYYPIAYNISDGSTSDLPAYIYTMYGLPIEIYFLKASS